MLLRLAPFMHLLHPHQQPSMDLLDSTHKHLLFNSSSHPTRGREPLLDIASLHPCNSTSKLLLLNNSSNSNCHLNNKHLPQHPLIKTALE